jgi:serine protease Do
LAEAKGAIITDVKDKKSAAANAGLQTGDIILEYNGEKISGATDLVAKIASTAPAKEINVVYLREVGTNLERRTALVKIAERPTNSKSSDEETTPKKMPISDVKKPVEPFGLTLIEITPQLAAVYKLEGAKGLIIKNINPASYIADVKNSTGGDALGEGDLIQRINRANVTDLKTFNETVSKLKKGDAVVLQIQSYDLRSRSIQYRIVQFTVQ